ncbi:MAG: beta-ketoacyl synthase chain length factor [Saprospiraceae bacterium]
MAAYILGMGKISPGESAITEMGSSSGLETRTCQEPDYGQWIDGKQMRRLSRILKMSYAAASMAIADSKTSEIDGVIVGTGLGCMEDTQSFLAKMIEQNEFALNPTPFIQSTHNTIAGTIALMRGYRGYNQTYTQNFLSFEQALVDVLMLANSDSSKNYLLGAADEIIPALVLISQRLMKEENISKMTIGEGACFFVLSGDKPEGLCCEIIDVETIFHPKNMDLKARLEQFLDQCGILGVQIELLALGSVSTFGSDMTLQGLVKQVIPQAAISHFKDQCGEYSSAGSYGLSSLAEQLMESTHRSAKYGILINVSLGKYYSFTLLRSCPVTA